MFLLASGAARAFTATEVRSFDYDELGRVIAERSGAEGRLVARYAHDAEGRVTEIANGKGEVTRLAYDPLGRVASSTDAAGGITRYTHDAADRITSVTDPRGLTTTYRYNAFGDLLEQRSPDTGTTTHSVGANGLRERTTRNDGSALAFRYDVLGRMVEITGGADRRTYAYDTCGAGFLCEAATLRSGTLLASTRFTRSADGDVLARTDAVGGASDVTRFGYDAFGRLSRIDYPGGASVGYAYTLGRLARITATDKGVTQTVIDAIRYRPFGGPEAWTYGNGLQRRYNIDDKGRVFGLSAVDATLGRVSQSLTYGFEAADRIAAITNAAGQPARQDFGYDAAGRLAWDDISGQGGHALAFDPTGNRVRHGWGGEVEQHAIDPHSNRLLAIGGTSNPGRHHVYDHDLRGNRVADTTSGVTTHLAYDAFDRLRQVGREASVEVCEPYGSCKRLPAGTTDYVVNALDQRVAKSGSQGATRFVYGGQTQLLAEHGPQGWKHYIWFGGELVGLLTPTQGTVISMLDDMPIVLGHQGVKYVHNDHLGRPEAVTSGNQVSLWRAKNHAFDRHVVQDLIGGLHIGFPGQYYDAESDLWSNGYRDVDQKGGRYAQTDPLGLRGGINPYIYAFGSPTEFIDSDGLQAYSWLLNSKSTNDSIPHVRPPHEETIVMGQLRNAATVSAGIQLGILGGMLAPVAAAETLAVCKDDRVREAAREACMAAGLCWNTGPRNPPDTTLQHDRMRVQQIREGATQEAKEVWRIIYPAP